MRWPFPTSKLTLHPTDVHIWVASLDSEAESCDELLGILSPDERKRSYKFMLSPHRERFIAARGLLRMVLSSYNQIAPQDIQFCYSRHGKPLLAKHCGGDVLHFNLSHSEGLVLYVVAQGRPVGIDLECVRKVTDMDSILTAFFSENESQRLRLLPADQQLQAFFAGWTRKEAYLKAIGAGVSESMQSVEVLSFPDSHSLLLDLPWQGAEPWHLVDLDPAPGYVASLAVAGRDVNIRCLRWPQWKTDPVLASAGNPLDNQLN